MGGLSSADGTYTILDGATIGKSYNEAGLTSIYVTTPFTNNAVVYVSPEFGGVKFHAMYSNGLYDDTNKWSKNTHTYGAGLTYGSERAKGSVMYEVIDSAVDFSPMNANSGDVKSKDTQIFTVGSQYRFDSFTLYGTYQYVTHARLLPDFDITLTDAAINSGMIKKGFNSHAFSVSGAFPVFGFSVFLLRPFPECESCPPRDGFPFLLLRALPKCKKESLLDSLSPVTPTGLKPVTF